MLGACTLALSTARGAEPAGPGLALRSSDASRADPARDVRVTTLLGQQANALRRVTGTQMSHLRGRLQALRGGDAACRSAQPVPRIPERSDARRRTSVAVERDGIAVAGSGFALPLSTCRRGADATAWSAGSLEIGSAPDVPGGSGVRFRSPGLTLGADRRLAAPLRVGVAIGLARERDGEAIGGADSADGLLAAAYASYRPNRSLFVDATGGYGSLQLPAARQLWNGVGGSGERRGTTWFASVAAGYRLALAGTEWSPYTRFDALGARLLAYADPAGPEALRFQHQDVPAANAALGIEGSSRLRTAFGQIVPRARLELRREIEGAGNAAIAYVDDATSYVLDAAATARTAMTLELGFAWTMTRAWAVDAGFSRDVASDARSSRFDMRVSWPLR